MSAVWALPAVHRDRLSAAADYLAIALVVSLPWSTSVTGIVAALWLIALLPTLDLQSVRRAVAAPAGSLPVVLVALAALGMLWADVAWSERFEGCVSYLKLAVIPLLFVQFRRSERGSWVIHALLSACVTMLVASYVAAVYPELSEALGKQFGLVVKDYISQSGFFTLAAFILLHMAWAAWRKGRRIAASIGWVLVALFLANMVFVVSSRTAFLVIPVLVFCFGFVHWGWKGGLAASLVNVILLAAVSTASPYLRDRILSTLDDRVVIKEHVEPSSTRLRLAFWKASVDIVKQAPVVGYGTGSIRALYHRYGTNHRNAFVEHATNPHNQTFAVAMQLGLLGTVVLYAMWLFHFLLFRGDSLIAWFGTVVVLQNFVSSLVNSHLFDFTQGWTYAVLVGMTGGMMLRQGSPTSRAEDGKR